MIVGCPKEIKILENRVGLTPSGAAELVEEGHQVFIEQGAGVGSGFTDEQYLKAGASILGSAKDVYLSSDLIVKVKEPQPAEYGLIKKGQILFTYFHFASSQELVSAMIDSGATCIAYETVRDKTGQLPLLVPMSQIAGRLSVLEGIRYLTKPFGGLGILPGGIPGVKPSKITIIGAGAVGTEAAKVAAGIGADVTVLDINPKRMLEISETLPANVTTLFSNQENLKELLPQTDLLVGAVLIPGAKAPKLVGEELISTMKPGSVIADVAIDQGGCVATSAPTSFKEPVFQKYGVTHYAVTNMPGAVPRTSTIALTQVTLPYVKKIAKIGYQKLSELDFGFAKGVSISGGKKVSDEF